MGSFCYLVLAIAASLGVLCVDAQSRPDVKLSSLTLPQGFQIALYTNSSVNNARSLAIGGNASVPIVYASSNGGGVISAIVDRNSSGQPVACTLIRGLNNPEGLAYLNGSLYIGQVRNVTRYDNVDSVVLTKNCMGLSAPVLIASPFPSTTDHNARHIEIGPDQKLYVSYGSPANVDTCEKYGNINSCSIIRMNLDGSEVENYVVGVRNTVGFTWQPDSRQFFFNMIERDLLGDNRPDDVLFLGQGINSNYSWPYCHREGRGDPYHRDLGAGIPFADPDVHDVNQTGFIKSNAANLNATLNDYCNRTTIAPLLTYGPHVSALGLKFYTGNMFPSQYVNSLFVPLHGSWNRALQIGYNLVNVKLDSTNVVTDYEIFASGWLQNQNTTQQSVWGRPVATAQLPDGSLLLSDDKANAVYRISYTAPTLAPSASTPSVSATLG